MTGSIVKNSLLTLSFVLLAVIGFSSFIAAQDEKDELYKKFDIFVEVLNKIRNDYVEQVDPENMFDGAMKGMANTLDAESSYMTAEEYSQYKAELTERTAETGLVVIKHPGNRYAYVVNIIPGSPAESAGMTKGDFIRAIDNKSTSQMPIKMIELLLKGEPGSTARLSVVRSGVQGLLSFEVERKQLNSIAFSSEIVDNIGIIRLSSFDDFVLEDISETCDNFATRNIETVIIDVRDNISRNFEEAIHSAELFVSDKEMVKVVSRDEPVVYTANSPAYDFNLIVLTNDSTGRAAEVFALALKTTGRAQIIGEQTLGIATLQREVMLEDGAYLNISYATIESADGTAIHGEGITPGIEVDETAESSSEVDAILNRALKRAKEIQQQEKAA